MFVAQATVCASLRGEGIRAAQRDLVDPAKGIFAGPDTDQIGEAFRYDGCHFDGEGGKRVADLWLSALLHQKKNEVMPGGSWAPALGRPGVQQTRRQ